PASPRRALAQATPARATPARAAPPQEGLVPVVRPLARLPWAAASWAARTPLVPPQFFRTPLVPPPAGNPLPARPRPAFRGPVRPLSMYPEPTLRAPATAAGTASEGRASAWRPPAGR